MIGISDKDQIEIERLGGLRAGGVGGCCMDAIQIRQSDGSYITETQDMINKTKEWARSKNIDIIISKYSMKLKEDKNYFEEMIV